MSYLIWSLQHSAWWAPRGLGYTTATHRAGLYSFEEATQILAQAGDELRTEIMIPAPLPTQIDHDLNSDLDWPELERAGRVDLALARQLSRAIAKNFELRNELDLTKSLLETCRRQDSGAPPPAPEASAS
jgi:hypothetical protein